MNPNSSNDLKLPPALVESVLAALGLKQRPEATLAGLRVLYGAWCHHVPFDNVRKVIHLRLGKSGPFPGTHAQDFLEAWLRFNTGGTCWAGSGAWHALLSALGFNAVRGIATMLVVPGLPPNHGTVRVAFGEDHYLVDTSILSGEPIPLKMDGETGVDHPAWGVQCRQKEGHWQIAWRPLHKLDGFECRLERFGATAEDYHTMYEATRGWSPFNYEVTARRNKGDRVLGVSFGRSITLQKDGSVHDTPIDHAERDRFLIEEVGISEEIVRQLPADVPTPPPPWSQTAQSR